MTDAHPGALSGDLPEGDLPEGTLRSPNIWGSPQVYEIENRAVDRAGVILALMRTLASWTDRDLLDVGCGTGFHLPIFAEDARTVTGVEPHPDLLAIARRRTRRIAHVDVIQGSATDLPLADHSVDVVHARWAYFFGPGCEPGLAELDRVVRPGGSAFVIDNDPSRSTFGSWFRRGYPDRDHAAVVDFWLAHGWKRHPLEMAWTFDDRADLEAVLGIEFPSAVVAEILAEHHGTSVDYALDVWSKQW